jgi:hypothetical protein
MMTDTREYAVHHLIMRYLEAVLIWPTTAYTTNNNPRSAVAGARQKALGTRKGLPDIQILRTCGRSAWIEVKALKGRLSPEQRAFQEWCREAGHPHCVARSIDDVRNFLQAEHIPNRDTETVGEAAARLLAGMDRKRSAA